MVAWKQGHCDMIIWKDKEVVFHETVKRVNKTVEKIKEAIPQGDYSTPLNIMICVNLDKRGHFVCPTCVANYVKLSYKDTSIALDRLINQTLIEIVLRLSIYYVVELSYCYSKEI